MRVFGLSDLHVDYDVNRRWIEDLSASDYRNDLLILAGDISDDRRLLEQCLTTLAHCFARVLYVPGNHELWVFRDRLQQTSFDKFKDVCRVARDCGVSMDTFHHRTLSIVPLLAWYDYSFGMPGAELLDKWVDYRACRWPEGADVQGVTQRFLALNERRLETRNETIISFSHFVPRLDVMPDSASDTQRQLYPVLGSAALDAQIRRLEPIIHLYGHSHINRQVRLDDVLYVNNAFGYPSEAHIAAKRLVCLHET
jgi:Icc-related predicted phosphoesterase